MGEQGEGGFGGLLDKANKWLKKQGVTKEELAKGKADQEGWEAERVETRDAKAREDREAHVGSSHVTLSGQVEGSVDKGLSVQTEQGEGTLYVTVECVDPVPLKGGSFVGLSFAIPGYTGAGAYDLSTKDLTGLTFELMLEPAEEGFFWAPEYGPGMVTVAAGGSAEVHFVYKDPGSNQVELKGAIELG